MLLRVDDVYLSFKEMVIIKKIIRWCINDDYEELPTADEVLQYVNESLLVSPTT